MISGKPFSEDEEVFVGDGDGVIGRKYIKAIYRGYTEDFGALVARGAEEEHLGLLGPVIRGVVGDTIVVHFRNNTRFGASIHPHGVLYKKNAEGAPYADGTFGADKDDDVVAPRGGEFTYLWKVPERAGPGPRDPSSIVWQYHSHVDGPASENAGMIGLIVISRKGQAKADGSPKGIDREFFSLFKVFDENASLFLDANIEKYTSAPVDPEDDGFVESNLMHGINGLVWGNNAGHTMRLGEKIRWYVIAMGTEVDLHTPHWHGVTLVQNGNRVDVV